MVRLQDERHALANRLVEEFDPPGINLSASYRSLRVRVRIATTEPVGARVPTMQINARYSVVPFSARHATATDYWLSLDLRERRFAPCQDRQVFRCSSSFATSAVDTDGVDPFRHLQDIRCLRPLQAIDADRACP